LVNRVKEWLGPEKADDIQRWLEAVRVDLQQQQGSLEQDKGEHREFL
jgi:hypothetical protein